MSATRHQICETTSRKVSAGAAALATTRALIGLDGFVDEIIAVVDKRINKDVYEKIKTIEDFGQKILAAAGQSSNYELVVRQEKLGGNGPIMANALASAGIDVTYIGNLGYPAPHAVFDAFTKRAHVMSIATPGYTEALEFDDGKLMLGKHGSLKDVNWANIKERIGLEKFIGLFDGSKLVGMVNWTMLPQMSQIWASLQEEVLPKVSKKERYFFVDLADPEKRTQADISDALKLLSKFQGDVNVILGLNLKESTQVAAVLGMAAESDAEAAIARTAAAIRERLKISCVVIHPRKGAAAAIEGETAEFAGPFVKEPKISTGAGDHFNAGFCLGRVMGLSLQESLCTGVATSGFYVRSAESPTAQQLAEFIANLPAPQ